MFDYVSLAMSTRNRDSDSGFPRSGELRVPNAVLYSRFTVLGVKMKPICATIFILFHIVYDLYRNMNFLSVAYQSIISISDTSRLASIESQAICEQSLFQVLSQNYFDIRFLYNTNCSNRQ